MKLDYKSKKWDKEMKRLKTAKVYYQGNYLKNIESMIEEFYENDQKEYFWLCSGFAGEYELAARRYLVDGDISGVINSTYLSALAFIILEKMYKKEELLERDKEKVDLSEMEYVVCKLIATECYTHMLEICQETITGNLLIGNTDKAKILVEQLNNETEEVEDIYYNQPIFLKSIYEAILNKDEAMFNVALMKRIKKYRTNMVGYSTIIDYTSIALIKIAKKYGINSEICIVEIPNFFFEPINVDEVIRIQLPLQKELEKLI